MALEQCEDRGAVESGAQADADQPIELRVASAVFVRGQRQAPASQLDHPQLALRIAQDALGALQSERRVEQRAQDLVDVDRPIEAGREAFEQLLGTRRRHRGKAARPSADPSGRRHERPRRQAGGGVAGNRAERVEAPGRRIDLRLGRDAGQPVAHLRQAFRGGHVVAGDQDAIGLAELAGDGVADISVLGTFDDGERVGGQQHRAQADAGRQLRAARDRSGQRHAAGFDQHLAWCGIALAQASQRADQVAAEAAAHAAAGQFEHVVALRENQVGIDPDLAEVVDQDGDAPAVGLGLAQPAIDQRGLAGAQVAADHRDPHGGFRFVGAHWEAASNTRPPCTTPQTGTSRKAAGATSQGSCSSTAKSARLPVSIEPTSLSSFSV